MRLIPETLETTVTEKDTLGDCKIHVDVSKWTIDTRRQPRTTGGRVETLNGTTHRSPYKGFETTTGVNHFTFTIT